MRLDEGKGTVKTPTMEPLGIHHVSINVSSVADCVAFYTDLLGGSVRSDRPDLGIGGAWIDLGASQVHLVESDPPNELGQHFAILVEDLDATVQNLREMGVTVGDPFAIGSGRQTFVNDPSGNLVEIHQANASA